VFIFVFIDHPSHTPARGTYLAEPILMDAIRAAGITRSIKETKVALDDPPATIAGTYCRLVARKPLWTSLGDLGDVEVAKAPI